MIAQVRSISLRLQQLRALLSFFAFSLCASVDWL
jgi:hypothetical protein